MITPPLPEPLEAEIAAMCEKLRTGPDARDSSPRSMADRCQFARVCIIAGWKARELASEKAKLTTEPTP